LVAEKSDGTDYFKVLGSGGIESVGPVLLKNASGAQPTFALTEDPDNGANTVTLQAPATLADDYTLTLPVDDGTSGQLLQTDGSGVLTWASPIVSSLKDSRGCCGDEIASGDTGVTYNITPSGIALTAGTWDISGSATFRAVSSAQSVTNTIVGISTTSATLPSATLQSVPDSTTGEIFVANSSTWGGVSSDRYMTVNIPTFRATIASTDTVFLVGAIDFTTGFGLGFIYSGFLEARKVSN
jgi:hypothetical protein